MSVGKRARARLHVTRICWDVYSILVLYIVYSTRKYTRMCSVDTLRCEIFSAGFVCGWCAPARPSSSSSLWLRGVDTIRFSTYVWTMCLRMHCRTGAAVADVCSSPRAFLYVCRYSFVSNNFCYTKYVTHDTQTHTQRIAYRMDDAFLCWNYSFMQYMYFSVCVFFSSLAPCLSFCFRAACSRVQILYMHTCPKNL